MDGCDDRMSRKVTPLKAVRRKCLSCCIGQYKEVEHCPAKDCPIWPYRFGRIPKPKPNLTVLKAIRARCLDCSGFSYRDVRECWNTKCPLYPFRMGRNPNRAGIGNMEALRRWREEQKMLNSQAETEEAGELVGTGVRDE